MNTRAIVVVCYIFCYQHEKVCMHCIIVGVFVVASVAVVFSHN